MLLTEDGVDSLTERLFALEEPWRSRFFALLATWAGDCVPEGHLPARAQVAAWLWDPYLYRDIIRLLRLWQRKRM